MTTFSMLPPASQGCFDPEDRLQRLHRLRRILGPGGVPTLGAFAIAVRNSNVWRDGYLAAAIGDADQAGVYLPKEWRDLAGFATLFPRGKQWQDAPSGNMNVLLQLILGAVRSSHPALAWSGWFVLVEAFHCVQGVLRSQDSSVRNLLQDFIKNINKVARPKVLPGGEFECALLWLGVDRLKTMLRSELSGNSVPRLAVALETSKHAMNVLREFLPDWHPGQLIRIDGVRIATEDLVEILNGSRYSRVPSVVASEFQLAPYLNLAYDLSISIAKTLPNAAYLDDKAPVAMKKKALELSGLWAVTAWEAVRGRRLWEERRLERRVAGCDRPQPLIPIHERETQALDLAVKGFRAAGLEHTAAALASLLTSYVLTDRGLRLKGVRGEASPEERENRFRRLRKKHGQLIRQLGFEIIGSSIEVSPEAEAIEKKIRARKEGFVKERVFESLHELVAHTEAGEDGDWRQIRSLISGVPSLHKYSADDRKLPLLHVLYHTLVAAGSYSAITQDAPAPDILAQELATIRHGLIPIIFRLCLRQWRLRWAARLLTLPQSSLNGGHLTQFLYKWKFALASAPEFAAQQTEFHHCVRSALSQHCDGRNGLDDNQYFEALELLHSPILSLLDTRRCSTDELFDRWVKRNHHTLALDTGFDRRRLGLRGKERGAKHKPSVRIPSLQRMHSFLAELESRTGHRAVWVSFVLAGTEIRPELRGMTLRADHTSPRWREDLSGASLETDAKEYIDRLGVSMLCDSMPIELEENSPLEQLVDRVLKELGNDVHGSALVLMSGPPELNCLPWRWLLHSRSGARGSNGPTIFVVPSASWLVTPTFAPIRGKVTVRTGHGNVTEMEAGFKTTAIVPVTQERTARDPQAHFAELRYLCEHHERVVDNRCFAGYTERYRTCEWSGNPAMLLMTRCRLLVAPPCEIPASTADELTRILKVKSTDPLGLVGDLNSLAARDSAAWIYNLYGAP